MALSLFVLFIAAIEVFSNIYKDNIRIKGAIRGTAVPRIRRACPPQLISPHPEAKIVLILDPSERFHQGDLVSVFYMLGDVEIEIGYGEVLNIHESNKLIQIEAFYISREDILNGLLNNNADYLKRVEVRPHISAKRLEEYRLKEEKDGRR